MITPILMQTKTLRFLIPAAVLFTQTACQQKPAAASTPAAPAPAVPAAPAKAAITVTVSVNGMTRGGKPYFVQGVGGDKGSRSWPHAVPIPYAPGPPTGSIKFSTKPTH